MDIDVPWLYEFFDPTTPVILVSTPGPSGESSIRNILPNWVRTAPFLRNGYGVQHMKASKRLSHYPRSTLTLLSVYASKLMIHSHIHISHRNPPISY